jgi:hypothetical protein
MIMFMVNRCFILVSLTSATFSGLSVGQQLLSPHHSPQHLAVGSLLAAKRERQVPRSPPPGRVAFGAAAHATP